MIFGIGGLAGFLRGCELVDRFAVGAGFEDGWFSRVGVVQTLGGEAVEGRCCGGGWRASRLFLDHETIQPLAWRIATSCTLVHGPVFGPSSRSIATAPRPLPQVLVQSDKE